MMPAVRVCAFAAVLLPAAAGLLQAEGRLLVSSRADNRVLAYDGLTGAYLGTFISDPGRLRGPGGLAFGPDGNLYVASIDTSQVLRYDARTGAFAGVFTSEAAAPTHLAWGPDGLLYVVSAAANQVLCFSADGTMLRRYFGPSMLSGPAGIAVSGNEMYVASTNTNRVLHIAVNGDPRDALGAEGRMSGPVALAVGPDGNVYVVNAGVPDIQRYSPEGKFLDAIPIERSPDTLAFPQPVAIAFGPDGDLYMSTRQNTVIRIDSQTGASKGVFASGQMDMPVALAFAASGAAGPALSMRKVSGDLQETSGYKEFTYPLVVEVQAADGGPARDEPVTFTVRSGPAFVWPLASATDKQGRISAAVAPGFGAGPVTVVAADGTASVEFSLNVRPEDAAEPVIAGVTHAARMQSIGSAGYELAQLSAFTLTGKNLAVPDAVTVTAVPGLESYQASVLSAEPAKITAQLPAGVPLGEVNITVTSAGVTGAAARAVVVPTNFGIYTRNGAGWGPAAATAYDNSGRAWAPTLTGPAHPGNRVALNGTGIGTAEATGLEVLVGGKAVAPYSMAVGTADEVSFEVPEDITPGCYVPVAVRTGGLLSNFATLPISASGTDSCEHPMRLPAEILSNLDNSVPVPAGVLGLIRLALETPFGTGWFVAQGGTFTQLDAGSAFAPGGIATTVTDGACTVFHSNSGLNIVFPVPLARGLDAGAIAVTSPEGGLTRVPRRSSGAYDQSGFLEPEQAFSRNVPGAWTITGSGGSEVAAFEAQVDLPVPVEWTNPESALLVHRATDLTITWDTSGDNRPDHVVFSGLALGTLPGSRFQVQTQFACAAPFGAGSLTVPSVILMQLPATGDQMLGLAFLANSGFDARTRAFRASTADGADFPVTAAGYVVGRGVLWILR